jgi:sugar/nucleoside kinase (ribokinase family)
MNRPAPDYLIFGHITQDLVEGGTRLGGTAIFCSILAQRLGMEVALVTSFAGELDLKALKGIQIINQQGQGTTTFRNIYGAEGRTQYLLDRAKDLEVSPIPEQYRQAKIVHLAPVAREIHLEAGKDFPNSALVYSLQGWLRDWDQGGLVHPTSLPALEGGGQLTGTAFLSIEDLGFSREKLDPILKVFPDLVLTTGGEGAEIYSNQEREIVTTKPFNEVDPTGAGDIFAAAFIIARVILHKSPRDAACFANILAGISITRPGIEGIPTVEELAEAQKVY